MVIVKVLKRRDAASLVVAIVLGTIVSQFIQMLTSYWGFRTSHLFEDANSSGAFTSGPGWREQVLAPILTLVFSLVVLELLLRVFVAIRPQFVSRKK